MSLDNNELVVEVFELNTESTDKELADCIEFL